ncbi:MAG: 4Fe-4S binding protein [Candidatus Omnitrophica bacterium]|nr:4Fe-4S binding protein [Candidatus Omnitrophota bacterium]
MSRPGKIARLLMQSLFKKPATENYPADRSGMPEGFRGKLKFNAQMCIGCKMCTRDCPSSAIEIRKIGEKQFEAEINLAKCIYCGQCVDSCPKNALEITAEFELARLDLKVIFNDGNKDNSKG